jgi:F-type H+-transporting ATPase subunit epsilon
VSLDLEILVPDGVVVQTPVAAVQAADASGRFGLLPGHGAFLTLLTPCLLVYRETSGKEQYAAVDGGVLLLEGRQVSVVTREAVVADRLDEVADAAAAMLRARRAAEQTARAEFAELQFALLRELREVEQRR